ncbi:tripartite motif-containing protein 16-like [Polypterus senegalus]|nr:tripartite motif-containing protein 16-like [Polypterus senegalus]
MMAAAKPSASVVLHSCSMCLDVLKEPVSLTCGHNYCMGCISEYWDQSETDGIYNCPQCREIFNERPVIKRNDMIKDIIEKVKDKGIIVSPSQSYAGSDAVPCDVCTGNKMRAVKTCLTCVVCYCEIHLQPHLASEALRRHKMLEPTENIKNKLCKTHKKVLEVFCRTDDTCVCLMCATTEHKSHDMVTAEEERAERQSQLENRKAEMKNKIQEKEEELEEMKGAVMRIQYSADSEVQENEEIFRSLLQSIERLRSEVTEVIKDYERKEVRKVEEVIKRLEKEIKELKRRDTELVELSQTDDYIYFLKKLPTLCVPQDDKDKPDINVNGGLLPETLKKNLTDLKRSLKEISGWKFVKRCETGVSSPGHVLQNLRLRDRFLKYSCPLTLDPNTANRRLHLSEDNIKVTDKKTGTQYPNHPDRFDYWEQILCTEALRWTSSYWEVEWSGSGVAIGVTYKGISRKGKSEECRLGHNNKSWSLTCSDTSLFVWHNNKSATVSVPNSHRIGVYLDCLTGSLSFYSISDTMTLLHTFKISFTEPVYPGFGVGWDSSITICPLNLSD